MAINLGQAFLDESDSGNSQSGPYILGGWIASRMFWDEFSDVWKRTLEAPKRLDYLKFSEALLLRGQFAGWTEQERDDKLCRLAETIPHDDDALQGVACHITQEMFRERAKPAMRRPWNTSPYFVLAMVLMLWVVENRQYQCFDKIDFILDRDKCKRSTRITRFFDERIKPLNPRFGQCLDLPDQEWMPLQMADMAVSIRRQTHESHPLFTSAATRLNGILTAEVDLDERSLKYLFECYPGLSSE